MSAIEIIDLDAEAARRLTDRIRIAVEGTWELVRDAYQGRVWIALGYSNWDDYTTREFGNARLRLPREERQEQVASLRESGLSLRAIATGLGISDKTVRTDLAAGVVIDHTSTESNTPKVTGQDGKQYPAAVPLPPKVELPAEPTLNDYVAAYPDLQWFVDGGHAMKALGLGKALATYREPELSKRIEALHATVEAEKRGATPEPVEVGPDYRDLAHQMYLAMNRAEAIFEQKGGTESLALAMSRTDLQTIETWRHQFERVAALAADAVAVIKPSLRRTK